MLWDCSVSLLLNKQIEEEILQELEYDESLILVIIILKKSLLSASTEINFKTLLNDSTFLYLFKSLSTKPKTNLKSLEESIMNKTLRRCFDNWQSLKKIKLSGQIEHHNKFFKFLFKEMAEELSITSKMTVIASAESLIEKFKRKSQMDRKQRTKNLRKMHARKSKFMNLVLRNEQLEMCKTLKLKNKLFMKSFDEIKDELLNEYKELDNIKDLENAFRIKDEEVSTKDKQFGLNVRKNLLNSILKIQEYSLDENFELNSEKIKRDLRNLKFPFTLNELRAVFKYL